MVHLYRGASAASAPGNTGEPRQNLVEDCGLVSRGMLIKSFSSLRFKNSAHPMLTLERRLWSQKRCECAFESCPFLLSRQRRSRFKDVSDESYGPEAGNPVAIQASERTCFSQSPASPRGRSVCNVRARPLESQCPSLSSRHCHKERMQYLPWFLFKSGLSCLR